MADELMSLREIESYERNQWPANNLLCNSARAAHKLKERVEQLETLVAAYTNAVNAGDVAGAKQKADEILSDA